MTSFLQHIPAAAERLVHYRPLAASRSPISVPRGARPPEWIGSDPA